VAILFAIWVTGLISPSGGLHTTAVSQNTELPPLTSVLDAFEYEHITIMFKDAVSLGSSLGVETNLVCIPHNAARVYSLI